MSYREELLSNVDNYGYPMPPPARRKLRKKVVSTSRGIVGKGIFVLMSIIGGILWLSRRGQKYPLLMPQTFHPTRILVIRLDLIGDLVLSLTVVRALKRTYPEAEIDLLRKLLPLIPTSLRLSPMTRISGDVPGHYSNLKTGAMPSSCGANFTHATMI